MGSGAWLPPPTSFPLPGRRNMSSAAEERKCRECALCGSQTSVEATTVVLCQLRAVTACSPEANANHLRHRGRSDRASFCGLATKHVTRLRLSAAPLVARRMCETGAIIVTASRPPNEASADRRVRYTLDLTREQHRFLRRFAFDAETDASVVMRALLALLESDEKLAQRVLSDLER